MFFHIAKYTKTKVVFHIYIYYFSRNKDCRLHNKECRNYGCLSRNKICLLHNKVCRNQVCLSHDFNKDCLLHII